MTNDDFWASINKIVSDGYTPEGLQTLNKYAEQFISGRLVYERFSPSEQHGCSTGGANNVIASLLAAAEIRPDSSNAPVGSFKREQQCAAQQEDRIENWARKAECWIENTDKTLSSQLGEQIAEGGEAKVFDNGISLIKTIGLDYYIQPVLALDRVSLHNTWFPETALKVIGFGRDSDMNFQVVAEQPFIQGSRMTEAEIEAFAEKLGFELINRTNWTYSTPEIYLSDLHDENVIKSESGNVLVIDCDIRINTASLKCNGKRILTKKIHFL